MIPKYRPVPGGVPDAGGAGGGAAGRRDPGLGRPRLQPPGGAAARHRAGGRRAAGRAAAGRRLRGCASWRGWERTPRTPSPASRARPRSAWSTRTCGGCSGGCSPRRSGSSRRPGPVLQRFAEAVLPEGRAYAWNQALMDLGATVCTARSPDHDGCPLALQCTGRAAGHGGGYRASGGRARRRVQGGEGRPAVRADDALLSGTDRRRLPRPGARRDARPRRPGPSCCARTTARSTRTWVAGLVEGCAATAWSPWTRRRGRRASACRDGKDPHLPRRNELPLPRGGEGDEEWRCLTGVPGVGSDARNGRTTSRRAFQPFSVCSDSSGVRSATTLPKRGSQSTAGSQKPSLILAGS